MAAKVTVKKYVVGTISKSEHFSLDMLKGLVYAPVVKGGDTDKAKVETALGNVAVASKVLPTIKEVGGLAEIPPSVGVTISNYIRAVANVVLGLTTVALQDFTLQCRALEARNPWLPEVVMISDIAVTGGKEVSSGTKSRWTCDARLLYNLYQGVQLEESPVEATKDIPADF